MSEPEGGGGRGFALHLPVWGWALVAGGGLGLFWFVRHRAASAAPAAADAGGGQGQGDAPTDIIPIDQGLSEGQFSEIMAAIQRLQGPASKPGDGAPKPKVPSPTPTPPKHKPPRKPGKPSSHFVGIDSFEDLQEVARSYGRTWQELWGYQLEKGVRPAATQATLRKRGPHAAFRGGSQVAVPTEWKKKR